MNDFNYEEKVEKIKSALFDLYEQEEYHISQIEDLKERDSEYTKYAILKDKALDLLNEIENLYKEIDINYDSNVLDEEEADDVEKELDVTEPDNIEEEVDSDTSDEEESTKESTPESNENKYYLDEASSAPNFAYVPERILERLKQRRANKKNEFYKQDSLETKGIIVRPDQFMKLSLSKNRQEGVLREAKQYRIDLATKSREQLLQVGGENEPEQ